MIPLVAVLYHPISVAGEAISLFLAVYTIYQRFFHPLARYPGPLVASLTDIWQFCQVLGLKQPYNLEKLHERYGSVVRYGPNKLSVTDEEIVSVVYQKGGHMFPKTEYYDAYGAKVQNVFGMRDLEQHSARRRHLSHSFSMSYVRNMEPYVDTQIAILRRRIGECAARNEPFDLKKYLSYYIIDTLGELAFSQPFGVQETLNGSLIPPVKEHNLLAAATGSWPAMTATLKAWLPVIPIPVLRELYAGRKRCVGLATACVNRRLALLKGHDDKDLDENSPDKRIDRKDILTSLILAKDPYTGKRLSEADLVTEAFGFINAGTHTTAATLTVLFYHLLHSPQVLSRCVKEIDENLPRLMADEAAYSVTNAESQLPFLRACIKENYRITPIFTMPLARYVTQPGGVTIANKFYPPGTSLAICTQAFHHNPSIWGSDHDLFNPDRWDNADYSSKSRLLMHFGSGSRQCLGKTIANTNIIKVMSTLLSEFDFELASESQKESDRHEKQTGKYPLPDMISVGISELQGELLVRTKLRNRAGNQTA